MPTPMIDWVIADWVAERMASRGEPTTETLAGIDLRPLAADADGRDRPDWVWAPLAQTPPPEAIDRSAWAKANLASTRAMMEPLLTAAASKLGPVKGTGRLWLGAVSSAEIGVLIGFMAQRVLGQYELILLDELADGQQPRLLFVMPNLADAVGRFEADELEFVTWVTLHEVTHAVQFGGVPWLRDYLASQVRELMESAQQRIDVEKTAPRLPTREDLARVGRTAQRVGRAALRLDLLGMVGSPRERAVMNRVQAVMAVIEGHAEHVMDAVAPELLPSLPQLRAAMDKRRKQQSGVAKYLGKLLGLEMKMRQYTQGKAFCDQLVAQAGTGALNHLFSSAEALPTLAEIEDPAAWLERNRAHL
jgi:coenzyme F420 biosynthesis associated uncharacterized protein